MKKSTKYSAVIAAALLAIAPMTISNTVKADENPAIRTDAKPNQDVNHAAKQEDPSVKNNPQKRTYNYTPYDQIKDPKEVKIIYDKDLSYNIKATNNLTWMDLHVYFMKHVHISIDGKEVNKNSKDYAATDGFFIRDEKGNVVNFSKDNNNPVLKKGYQIRMSSTMRRGEPNQWYTWSRKYSFDSLVNQIKTADNLDQITKSLAQKKDGNGYKLAAKTNDKGTFSQVVLKKETKHKWGSSVEFNPDQGPTVYIHITDDKNATAIPHLKEYAPTSQPIEAPATEFDPEAPTNTPVVPDKPLNGDQATQPTEKEASKNTPSGNRGDQTTQPTETEDPKNTPSGIQSDQATQPAEKEASKNTPATNQGDQATQPTKTEDPKNAPADTKENQTTKDIPSVDKPLMLTHNSFIYDKNGKIKNIKGKFVLKRKYKAIKASKIVTIKGKKYYQIGKNSFIKAANVNVVPKPKKVSVKATVKGMKLRHVRLYNSKGKYIKKYVVGKKHLNLDEKKVMRGHLYYRIKGTNNWIRANKIKLHK